VLLSRFSIAPFDTLGVNVELRSYLCVGSKSMECGKKFGRSRGKFCEVSNFGLPHSGKVTVRQQRLISVRLSLLVTM
jgi:hypothetical protein